MWTIVLSFFTELRDAALFIQPFIVFFTGCFTAWLLIRTRPRKFKPVKVSKEMVIINWSGHPRPKEASWTKKARLWEPTKPPYFNTSSWGTLRDSVQKLWTTLPEDIQTRLLQGDPHIVIVVPQLAAGLAMLLAIIHGKTGVFPTITCPLKMKDKNEFHWPTPLNLSYVRMENRKHREIKIEKGSF
jgi:hypothetical protein